MIATVALLASCNGNGSTSNSASGEQTDSVATQEAPAKDEVVKGPVTIENPSWTVDVPEGWEVVSNAPGSSQKNSSYLRIKPIERPEGAVGLLAVVIKSYPYKTNTVEQEQETFVKAFKVENPEKGTETIGGVKFSKIVKPAGNSGGIITNLCAPLEPEGNPRRSSSLQKLEYFIWISVKIRSTHSEFSFKMRSNSENCSYFYNFSNSFRKKRYHYAKI